MTPINFQELARFKTDNLQNMNQWNQKFDQRVQQVGNLLEKMYHHFKHLHSLSSGKLALVKGIYESYFNELMLARESAGSKISSSINSSQTFYSEDPDFKELIEDFKNLKEGFASKKKALTTEFNEVVIATLQRPMLDDSGKDAANVAMSQTASSCKNARTTYHNLQSRFQKLESRFLEGIKNNSKGEFSDRDIQYEMLEYTKLVDECIENYTQFMRSMINLSEAIMQKEIKLWGGFTQSFDNFVVLIGTKVSSIDSQEFNKLQVHMGKVRRFNISIFNLYGQIIRKRGASTSSNPQQNGMVGLTVGDYWTQEEINMIGADVEELNSNAHVSRTAPPLVALTMVQSLEKHLFETINTSSISNQFLISTSRAQISVGSIVSSRNNVLTYLTKDFYLLVFNQKTLKFTQVHKLSLCSKIEEAQDNALIMVFKSIGMIYNSNVEVKLYFENENLRDRFKSELNQLVQLTNLK